MNFVQRRGKYLKEEEEMKGREYGSEEGRKRGEKERAMREGDSERGKERKSGEGERKYRGE